MSTILIIEDDPRTRDIVRLYLNRDGHRVLAAGDGLQGLRIARESHPDLVILDLMLPGMDGLDVCRALRAESEVPIVMLTARVEEEDRLTGLDLGADDYVVKPFSPRELAARVRAILRRAVHDVLDRGPAELRYGEITVNARARTVEVGSTRLRLTPTELRLLALLMNEKDRVMSREAIIDRVLGDEFDGLDRVVDVHIASLRRKIEAASGGRRFIHTVYGLGYRFGDA